MTYDTQGEAQGSSACLREETSDSCRQQKMTASVFCFAKVRSVYVQATKPVVFQEKRKQRDTVMLVVYSQQSTLVSLNRIMVLEDTRKGAVRGGQIRNRMRHWFRGIIDRAFINLEML